MKRQDFIDENGNLRPASETIGKGPSISLPEAKRKYKSAQYEKKPVPENRGNQDKVKKPVPLRQITIRLTEPAYQVIDELARKNRLSRSEIVRVTCDNRLAEYLQNVLYVDEEQGDKILEQIMKIGTELSGIKYELHRIGVNYNQEIRIKNIEAKYSKNANTPFMMKKKDNEIQAAKGTSYSHNEFNRIITMFNKRSQQLSAAVYKLIG